MHLLNFEIDSWTLQMDKASIIGDSIVYVQELQQQIQTIEKEIAEIEEKVSSANCVAEEDSGGSGGSGSTESKEHAAGRGTSLEQVVEVVKPVIELNNTVMAASSSLVDPQDPSPGHSPTVEIQILNVSQYVSELPSFTSFLFPSSSVAMDGCSSSTLVFSSLPTPLRSVSVVYRWK